MTQGTPRRPKRGSALALPLLLALAASAPAAIKSPYGAPPPAGHVDAGTRYLSSPESALNGPAQALGLPTVGSQWVLWGGGATIEKEEVRLQASGWSGGLSAERAGERSEWALAVGELALEQLYPKGSFLITGGVILDYAELRGALSGPGGHSTVTAPLWGGGVTAGLRWPRATALGFFVRSGWVWLVGNGDWRGDQASVLGSSRFELSGPGLTAQLEMKF